MGKPAGMPGNVTETPDKFVSATLQVLEKAGVRIEDLANLRKYPHFLERMAEQLTHPRRIMAMALGDDEKLATMAVREIVEHLGNEQKMLKEVCGGSPIPSVVILAMTQLSKPEIYHIARLHNSRQVVLAATQQLSDTSLWALLNNEVRHTWRFEIFEDVYSIRNMGRSSGIKLPRQPV